MIAPMAGAQKVSTNPFSMELIHLKMSSISILKDLNFGNSSLKSKLLMSRITCQLLEPGYIRDNSIPW